jgi:hypothetical protein
VERTSRLGSRDLVASGIKCGPHGGKNSKTKSCTVSWLRFKTKEELGQPWGPSHEWRLEGGHTKSAEFAAIHQQLLGYLAETQSQG